MQQPGLTTSSRSREKNKNGETALWKLFDNCLPDGVKKSIHQDYPTFVAKKNSVRNCLNEGL